MSFVGVDYCKVVTIVVSVNICQCNTIENKADLIIMLIINDEPVNTNKTNKVKFNL